jgi:hypothetical protein
MWWRNKTQDALVQVLKEEVAALRLRHDTDTQRMDRLMEAMARRAGIDLVMPMPPPPPITEPIRIPNPWKDPDHVTDHFQKEKTQ